MRTALPLVLAAALASACGVVETVEQPFELARPAPAGHLRVEIENDDGDTCVVRGAGNEIRVRAVVTARGFSESEARDLAEAIADDPPVTFDGELVRITDLEQWVTRDDSDEIDIDVSRDDVRVNHVHHVGRADWGLGATVEWTVEVPFDTEVRIDSASGHACIESLAGPVALETASGEIDVRGVGTSVVARSGSGGIRVEGALSVDAKSASGEISVVGAEEKASAESVSGEVSIEEARGDVSVNSASGDVRIASALAAGARWDVKTVSGDVDFRLPRGSSFNVDVRSGSGEVASSFEVDAITESRTALAGRVGSRPTGRIGAESTSGDVRVDPQAE